MNLHLLIDDKFIDEFIELTEQYAVPGENEYVVYNAGALLKYVHHPKAQNIPYKSPGFKTIESRLHDYERVYIHYLLDEMCEMVAKSNAPCKFIWIVWGGDVYNHMPYELYDPVTKAYLQQQHRASPYHPLALLKEWKKKIHRRQAERTRAKAIQKMAFILHYAPYDYEEMKTYYPTKAGYERFYYKNRIGFEALDHIRLQGDKASVKKQLGIRHRHVVMLGNSGHTSNNHLDMIALLASLQIKDFDVLVPLSYGGDPAYNSYLKKFATNKLGERFIPLEQFMAGEDYFKLLNITDVAIMSQNRPQGGGNILGLLYLGKKIYLKEQNTIYRYFTAEGICLNEVAELLQDDNHLFSPLDEGTIVKNRALTRSLFSEEELHRNIQNILNL